MKAIKTLAICALCAIMAISCKSRSSEAYPGISQGQLDSVSYAVGTSFGAMLKSSNMGDINLTVVMKGMQDYLNKRELKITEDAAPGVIQGFIMKAQEVLEAKKEAEQVKWLAENAKNEGVQVDTVSNLQWKVINPGNMDVVATPEDTVEVNYEGKLIDGTVFDSSFESGQPVSFPLNRVITGWTEGIQKIGEGGEIILYVPYQLGYGSRQAGQYIEPFSTLIFRVELLKVKRVAKEEEKPAK